MESQGHNLKLTLDTLELMINSKKKKSCADLKGVF